MRKILIVLVLSFCVMNTVSYAVVFSDDFESGSLAQWTIEGRQAGQASIANVATLYGSRMGHLYQDGFTEIFISRTFDYQADLNFSFEMKVQCHSTDPTINSTYFADGGADFVFMDDQFNVLGIVYYGASSSTYPITQVNSNSNKHFFVNDGAWAHYSLDVEDMLSGITIDQSAIMYVKMQFGAYASANSYDLYANVWADNVVVTPEPATMLLLGLGAMMLRRKK